MKKTPTESELKDPQWWNDHAPNNAAGAWVSRQMINKQIRSVTWVESDKEGCLVAEDCRATFYRRPTKQSQEWDGSWPPILHCKCECTFAVEHHDTWHEGEVVFIGIDPEGREFFIVDTKTYQACYRSLAHVRPIRTKEQQEREDLEYLMRGDDEFFIPDWIRLKVADRILAKYELKELNS